MGCHKIREAKQNSEYNLISLNTVANALTLTVTFQNKVHIYRSAQDLVKCNFPARYMRIDLLLFRFVIGIFSLILCLRFEHTFL